MDNEYFIYKSYFELAIISEVIDPDEITSSLGIQSSRSFRKGDKIVSKNSTRTGEKKNNLWAIQTQKITSEEESISLHIQELRNILKGKNDIINSYKENQTVDVCIWIWIETDNAGIGLDLSDEELKFLNNISNRIHLSIICNKE
jgi:hypothetical protein